MNCQTSFAKFTGTKVSAQMNAQWAVLFETKKTSHKTKTLGNPLEEHKEIYFVCMTCLKNHKPFMQSKMSRNNVSTTSQDTIKDIILMAQKAGLYKVTAQLHNHLSRNLKLYPTNYKMK